MKILLVIDSLGGGGAERSLELLCDNLLESKIDFSVLVFKKVNSSIEKRMVSKFNVYFVKNKNLLFQLYEIHAFIRKEKFDLIHSSLFNSRMKIRLLKLINNKFIHLESLVSMPYSKERIVDPLVNKKALKIFKFFETRTANKGVTFFHAISKEVKNHYINEVNLPPDRVEVIYRGREKIIDRFYSRNENKNKFKLLNIGRHEYAKGQLFLLEAINNLIYKKKIRNFELTILGKEGNATAKMKAYIKKNKLDDFIKLEGYRSNIKDYLLNSDIFVFPSLYEGLGGAVIEAQSAGLPILCNNIPILKEVTPENYAYFFNSNNIDSITDAISFFLKNPSKINEFGEKSFENFINNFLLKENNNKLVFLYKKLYENPSIYK